MMRTSHLKMSLSSTRPAENPVNKEIRLRFLGSNRLNEGSDDSTESKIFEVSISV